MRYNLVCVGIGLAVDLIPMDIELLRRKIAEGDEDQLNQSISKGALKLTDEQIATVSFAFWLVYMAEIDLNKTVTEAWRLAKLAHESEAVSAQAGQALLDMISAPKAECPSCHTSFQTRAIGLDNPEYFVDKIKIVQALMGKTARVKLFYKLNEIRNDLSHNRIDDLKYEGKPLSDRATKEKILIDYFQSGLDHDTSKSDIWNSLSPEDQKWCKETMEKIFEEQSPT